MAVIIDIPKIPPEGAEYEGEEPAEVFDLAPDSAYAPEGPMRYRVRAMVVANQLVVQGRIEADFRAECCRCGVFCSTSVSESSFLRDYLLQAGQLEVDVTPDLREALLLAMPQFPLCSEACEGLCPQCGRNLNSGACGCRPPPSVGAWSALDGLKL